MPAGKHIRRFKPHNLKRPRFRADMKKENLYNLSRLQNPRTSDRTYFQQKWTAKSITRAYHARHVREGQWTRMFSRRPPAVVPMNPPYLAQNDGSDQASGRGSGREPLPQWLENERIDDVIREREPTAKAEAESEGKTWSGPEGERDGWVKKVRVETLKSLRTQYGLPRNNEATPYMQMVYHPLERRLDMAVWRALFASSAKQARQFVCHGGVKVNGVTMRYPSYLLNPGDMFSVEPERTLWGLGQNAGPMNRMHKILTTDMNIMRHPPPLRRSFSTARDVNEDIEESLEEDEVKAIEEDAEASILDEQESDDAALKGRKKTLKNLLSQTRELLQRGKEKKTMSSKTKQTFREFVKTLRLSQSRVTKIAGPDVMDLESRFSDLSANITRQRSAPQHKKEEVVEESEQEEEPEEIKALRRGPRWNPREYLSPFAFIPRYLEVNHAICSAVYLRHPVCGPGFAEVPTPYGIETGGLAFNWYLRRR